MVVCRLHGKYNMLHIPVIKTRFVCRLPTYAFTQGMNESVLGILFGISACFGLVASIAYPFIRKQFGLAKTGLFGLS
ncbi:hypothetical protein KUTeg_005998 [Tegillarca granosa]|uniref:Solute carrier family 40 member n=1 Tax=Tegillarca granosa TaxID=220873 RepID=A0ABQ9FF91_TEGGR|nr:hypothetical protein KUTeg_005998 [Tegillarca granosa]